MADLTGSPGSILPDLGLTPLFARAWRPLFLRGSGHSDPWRSDPVPDELPLGYRIHDLIVLRL